MREKRLRSWGYFNEIGSGLTAEWEPDNQAAESAGGIPELKKQTPNCAEKIHCVHGRSIHWEVLGGARPVVSLTAIAVSARMCRYASISRSRLQAHSAQQRMVARVGAQLTDDIARFVPDERFWSGGYF
jgi:hypothetical protein